MCIKLSAITRHSKAAWKTSINWISAIDRAMCTIHRVIVDFLFIYYAWRQKMCFDSITFQLKRNICSWSEKCVCMCQHQQKNVFARKNSRTHLPIHSLTHTQTHKWCYRNFLAFAIDDATLSLLLVLLLAGLMPSSSCPLPSSQSN